MDDKLPSVTVLVPPTEIDATAYFPPVSVTGILTTSRNNKPRQRNAVPSGIKSILRRHVRARDKAVSGRATKCVAVHRARCGGADLGGGGCPVDGVAIPSGDHIRRWPWRPLSCNV